MTSATAIIADAPPRSPLLVPQRVGERPRLQLVPPLVALGFALPTAVMLYLCFFPVNWGWLAWVALVPLLLLTRSRIRPITIYTMAFVGGLVFYWPVLQWMRVADAAMYYAWGTMATYCAVFIPVALFLIRYLDRRTPLPLILSAPLVWTALEYSRSLFFTGFPWYFLAHTQHDHLGVIQIADLTGAYGVTFLIVMANALLVELVLLHPAVRAFIAGPKAPARYERIGILIQVIAVTLLLFGVRMYGVYRLGQDNFEYGPRLALIQGSLDQRTRNDPTQVFDAGQHFVDLCDLAVNPMMDLIVWSETSYPYVWKESQPGVPAEYCTKDAEDIAKRWKNPVLLGLKSDIPDASGKRSEYNSALLLSKGKAIGRYDKIHLVPLGEYVPLRHVFPLMKKLSPYDYDYSVESGRQHTRFPVRDNWKEKDYTFGVLICFEDSDPDVARPYGGGDGQRPADFIVNTSNDGWFNGTSEHEQHLAICRFRAIECRRTVARSVNMGVSAVIDPNGRVLPPREVAQVMTPMRGDKPRATMQLWVVDHTCWGHDLPVSRWSEFKKVRGVIQAAIPIDSRTSLYARVGDWLPWTCWSALGVALFAGMVRRLRRPT